MTEKDHDTTIIGIDIGCTKICTLLCRIEENGTPSILGSGTSITTGTNKGIITDPSAFATSLERAIKRAECSAKTKASTAITTIPSAQLRFTSNTALISLNSPTGTITEQDRSNVLKKAQAIPKSTDETLLHAIPHRYKVDGHALDNPIGATGTHLEAEIHAIFGYKPNILLISKLLGELNIQVRGLCCDALALSNLYSPETRSHLIDCGGRFSNVITLEQEKILAMNSIPIGGETITSDIALCLNTSLPEAERVKVIYGAATAKGKTPSDQFQISSEGQRQQIRQSHLCDIIEARVDEWARYIENGISPSEQTPIILTGDAAKLNGLEQYLHQRWGAPISQTLPDSVSPHSISSTQLTALGAILYGLKTGAITPVEKKKKSILGQLKSVILN